VRVRQAPRADGFTLIEVLVALAIVTVGMAALLGTLSSAAGTTAYLQDKTLAEWIALNQVSTVRLSTQAPAKGDSEGEVDYAGRKWKWSQTVADMPMIPGVLRIDVKVRPSDVMASQDNAWFASVSGVMGDAVGAPRGDLPSWNTTPAVAGAAGAGPQPTQQTPPNTPATGTPSLPTPFNPTNMPPPPPLQPK
jgi:general secretion pathway protein I